MRDYDRKTPSTRNFMGLILLVGDKKTPDPIDPQTPHVAFMLTIKGVNSHFG